MADENSLPVPGTPPDPEMTGTEFRKLCEVIAKLRSPDGCPWDRVQTLETIKPHTLEETYELLEAIDSGDDDAIVEELGDVLLQVILDAQIGADENRFNLIQIIQGLSEKMIERHPHVFSDTIADTPEQVSRNWDQIKKKSKNRRSIFDGIPKDLPQLAKAERISAKAAKVGYDFPDRNMLFDKLKEELEELSVELFQGPNFPDCPATVETDVIPDEKIEDAEIKKRAESELGDILFVVANIARRWKINPEEALRKSNQKFMKRVRFIEEELQKQGSSLEEADLEKMEQLYQQGKQKEKREN